MLLNAFDLKREFRWRDQQLLSLDLLPSIKRPFLPHCILTSNTLSTNPWQAKLISEAAYYFTNRVQAMAFIVDLNATSLSMDEIKYRRECKQPNCSVK
ncbi:hypothetical protein E2542_SST10931 [Spatholobus suberectus]|nr:hypothetical protein E2542_SST10931 [Spatholobus suberectus]